MLISSTVLPSDLPRLAKGVSESPTVSVNLSNLYQPLKFYFLCSEVRLLHTNKSLLERIITLAIMDRYLKPSLKISKDFLMTQFPWIPWEFKLLQIFYIILFSSCVEKYDLGYMEICISEPPHALWLYPCTHVQTCFLHFTLNFYFGNKL